MSKNILTTILPLLDKEYKIPSLIENNLCEIRKYILSNNAAAATNNNNKKKQCYICQKYNTNLKLRQIQNFSRI